MSSLPLFVAICVLVIAYQRKERAQVVLPNLSPTATPSINNGTLYDAQLVYHNNYGTSIHHLQRQSDYILRSNVDTTQSVTPTVTFYANGQLEFEVRISEHHEPANSEFSEIDTVFVSSDIEGYYQAFVSLLQGNGIIDTEKNWIYNDNHLVLIGDMLDRGNEVLQVLWLIYKLEAEAEQQGGRVHYLLGNHEQMNLRARYKAQNISYVHPEYKRYARLHDIPYTEWFNKNAELGRWLNTKNTVLSIDKILYVHSSMASHHHVSLV